MSVFQGPLHEYPSIVVDCFSSINLYASAFFLSHCHKDHMEGLESASFAETLRTRHEMGVKLYCSETTKNLIQCDYALAQLAQYTIGIPIHDPIVISLKSRERTSEDSEKVVVTLLPAGHCVGSVMFLFEGSHGNVLYTGDFRLSPSEIEGLSSFQSSTGKKQIKSVYIDTTFCTPSVKSLPSREETADAVKMITKSWLRKGENYVVQLICSARYGYEFILKSLALYFGTKIHITSTLYNLYSCLPNMIEHFTLDQEASKIHACTRKKYQKRPSKLHCGLKTIGGKDVHVLRIKPSTMWFVMNNVYPKNLTRCIGGIYRVLHSMHASYSEIRYLVGFLRPKYVFPTVTPALASDILEAYKCLKSLQNDEPDSQEDPPSSLPEKDLGTNSRLLAVPASVDVTKENPEANRCMGDPQLNGFLSSSPPVKRRRKKQSKTKEQSSAGSKRDKDDSILPLNQRSSPMNQFKGDVCSLSTQNDSSLKRLFGRLSPPVRRKRKKYVVNAEK